MPSPQTTLGVSALVFGLATSGQSGLRADVVDQAVNQSAAGKKAEAGLPTVEAPQVVRNPAGGSALGQPSVVDLRIPGTSKGSVGVMNPPPGSNLPAITEIKVGGAKVENGFKLVPFRTYGQATDEFAEKVNLDAANIVYTPRGTPLAVSFSKIDGKTEAGVVTLQNFAPGGMEFGSLPAAPLNSMRTSFLDRYNAPEIDGPVLDEGKARLAEALGLKGVKPNQLKLLTSTQSLSAFWTESGTDRLEGVVDLADRGIVKVTALLKGNEVRVSYNGARDFETGAQRAKAVSNGMGQVLTELKGAGIESEFAVHGSDGHAYILPREPMVENCARLIRVNTSGVIEEIPVTGISMTKSSPRIVSGTLQLGGGVKQQFSANSEADRIALQ